MNSARLLAPLCQPKDRKLEGPRFTSIRDLSISLKRRPAWLLLTAWVLGLERLCCWLRVLCSADNNDRWQTCGCSCYGHC